MLNREMADRPANEALTRDQDVKKILFILFLSFLFIPSAHAQSGEDEESGTGRPASYVSAGYHHLSLVYKSDYSRFTERFPVGVYAEYGRIIRKKSYMFVSRRRSYILVSVNFNRKSELFDDDWRYIQNIIDLKTGIKHHWDPKFASRMSLYIVAQVGVEFYNLAVKIEGLEDRGNTSRNLAGNLGLGIYFKLHPSVRVDIAAGYRRVFDSRDNKSLGATYRYPYGRIGVVYPLGYR